MITQHTQIRVGYRSCLNVLYLLPTLYQLIGLCPASRIIYGQTPKKPKTQSGIAAYAHGVSLTGLQLQLAGAC